jgi:hypothetical protein
MRRCKIADENTNGRYLCTRHAGHDGPCAAVEIDPWPVRGKRYALAILAVFGLINVGALTAIVVYGAWEVITK